MGRYTSPIYMAKTAPKLELEPISHYQPVIVRKVINDSHYYYVDGVFMPSVTTILHETLPTAPALRIWLGEVGNDRAEAKMATAAERGTNIHNACESLLKGGDVYLREFRDNTDKKCIAGFVDWVNTYNPLIESPDHIEMTVASRHGFAGTLDIACKINDQPWIIDIKTTSGIYDSHLLQVVAYRQAFFEMTGILPNLGILHLNHRVKKGWTFVDKIQIKSRTLEFSDFMKVFEVYKVLNGGDIKPPPEADVYPDIINLYRKEDQQ